MPKTNQPPAQPDARTLPTSLNLTATAVIDLGAAADGQTPALPRFRMVAYTGQPMRIAGWRHPLIIDLAGLAIPSQSRPIRFGHDPHSGIGHTDSIRVEQGQLIAAGVVSRDTTAAREVVVSSKNGFPWQASVGASVEEFEFAKENQQVPALEKDWLHLTSQCGEPDPGGTDIPFSVIVPCRGFDEHRTRAWEWVRRKLAEAFPEAEIILSDDGGTGDELFNRCRAIMDGASRAANDVLVITDADVWSYGLSDAIEAVAAGAPWATPHGRIHRLTRAVTERLYAGHYPTPRSACERPPYVGNLGGGLVVVARRTLEQVPFDRRFQGWGREDDAWQMAAKCLLPDGVRFDHPLYHLWHPPQPSSSDRKRSPNQALYHRYRAVANNRPAMQSLLAEAGTAVGMAAQR